MASDMTIHQASAVTTKERENSNVKLVAVITPIKEEKRNPRSRKSKKRMTSELEELLQDSTPHTIFGKQALSMSRHTSKFEKTSIDQDQSDYQEVYAMASSGADSDDEARSHFYIEQEKADKIICNNKECFANGFPHKHPITSCKSHPYCIDERMEPSFPIEARVPLPLPSQHLGRERNFKREDLKTMVKDNIEFLKNVEEGHFGETGPQLEGTKTIPTQFSLDHYMAQQWNLDVENMPGILPEKLERFYSYSRKSLGSHTVKRRTNMTFEGKLKEWNKGLDEKKLIDLELMYLQSSCNPKIYDQIKHHFKKKERKSRIGQRKPDANYEVDIKKVSDVEVFPISWPTTLEVDPVINELNKEIEDVNKMCQANPLIKFSEHSANYYNQKRQNEKDEYRKKIMGSRLKQDPNSMTEKLTDSVKKRTESAYLTDFMQTTEIQELAQRQQQFRQLVQKRQLQSRTERAAQSQTLQVATKSEAMAGGAQRKNSQKLSLVSPKAVLSGTFSQRTRPQTSTTARTRNSVWHKTSTNKQQKARLLSTPKETKKRPIVTIQNQKGALPLQTIAHERSIGQDDLYSFRTHTQSITTRNMKHMPTGMTTLSSHNSVADSAWTAGPTGDNTKKKQQPPQKGLKTFTITVRHGRSGSSAAAPTPPHPNQIGNKSQYVSVMQSHDSLNQDIEINGPASIQTEGFVLAPKPKAPRSVGRNHHFVYTNILESHPRGKATIQRAFRSTKWQSEKDHLIESMADRMQIHKPKIKAAEGSSNKRSLKLSESHHQQRMLQQKLSGQFGIKDAKSFKMPTESQTFLSEVPNLLQDRQRQQQIQHMKTCIQKDTCKKMALQQLQENLKNAQAAAKANVNKRRGSISQSSRQQALTMSTLSMKEGKTNETVIVSDERNLSGKNDITTVKGDESMQQKTMEKEIPADVKPDVEGLTQQRIEAVRRSYIDKVLENQRVYKEKQALLDIDNSTGSMVGSARSPQSCRSNTSQPLQSLRSGFLSEPQSPGKGTPATGKNLRQIKARILASLDEELQEEPFKVVQDMELTVPDQKWTQQQLMAHIKDMESGDFWLQKGMQCQTQGEIDAAMDYYRQGLRKHPCHHSLIYSLAVCYSKLKKYRSAIHWFSLGINLHPRWLDGLCGIAIIYFNMLDFPMALKFSFLAKENAKGSYMSNSKLNLEDVYDNVSFLHASCLKMTGRFDEACKSYIAIEDVFRRNNSAQMASLLWGLILVPLSDERKPIADHFHYLNEYLLHMTDVPTPEMDRQNLLLSKYTIGSELQSRRHHKTDNMLYHDYNAGESPKLDWDKFPKSISTLLSQKPFFKRFTDINSVESKKTYDRILRRAEVELYDRNQVVFLNDRIGVVTQGSVEIRRHNNQNLLKPFIAKKAIEGDILGFVEGDNNYSASPLSWLLSMQPDTEVVFIHKQDWHNLWNIQRKFTEQQIVLQKLDQNPFFSKLNLITKYHLVYESLEQKSYFPGQLIMSLHERSPLCIEYKEFYKDGTSKFRRELDQKNLRSQDNNNNNGGGAEKDPSKKTSIYTEYIDELNKGKTSKHLKQMQMRLKQSSRNATPNSLNDIASASDESMSGMASDIPNEDLRKIEEVADDVDSVSSTSTDYGLNHGQRILEEKVRVAAKKSVAVVKDKINSVFSNLNINPIMTMKSEETNNELKPQVNRGSTASPPKIRNTTTFLQLPKEDESQLGDRSQSQSSPKRGLRQKRPLRKVTTVDVLSLSKHRIPRSLRKKHADSATAAGDQFLSAQLEEFTEVVKDEEKVELVRQASKQSQGFESISDAMSQERKQKPVIQHKFLVKKQIQRIKAMDKVAKIEHSNRKRNLQTMLNFTDKVENKMRSSIELGDKTGLVDYINDLTAEKNASSMLNSSKQQPQKMIKKQSSGLNNQLLINQLSKKVESLFKMVKFLDQGDDMLFKIIINLIKSTEFQGKHKKRIEPNGVHFIENGEVLIVGSQVKPVARMSKCEAFGLCEVLRSTGPEYLGDCRAGIMQVQTLFFTYDELKKRLSIPERVAMKQSSNQQVRLVDGAINFIQQRDNVISDKLRKF